MRNFFTLILVFVCGITASKAQFEFEIDLEPIPSINCYNQKLVIRFADTSSASNEEYILYKILANNQKEELGRSSGDSIVFFPKSSGYITVHNASSSKKSAEIILTVQNYQEAFLTYDKEAVCTGYTRNIEIYTYTLPSDTIKWYQENTLVSSGTLKKLLASESGTYSAKLTRGKCTYDVNGKANIKIGQINQAEISSENYPSVCDGFIVALNSKLPTITDTKLQWLKDGLPLTNEVSVKLNAKTSGLYQLQLTQGTCTSISGNFEVKVGELYTSPIAVAPYNQQNNELIICEGISFNLSLEDYTTRNDLNVKWYRNNTLVGEDLILNTFSDGNYRYQLTQGSCEVISPTLKVTYGEMSVLKLESPFGYKACEGQSLQAFVSNNNSTLANALFDLKLYRDGNLVKNLNSIFDLSPIASPGAYQVKGSLSDASCKVKSELTEFSFEKTKVTFDLIAGNPIINTCGDVTSLAENLLLPGSFDSKTTFTWLKDDEKIQTGNDKRIIVKSAGIYQLTANTPEGCTYESKPITVNLRTLDIGIENANSFLCQGLSNYLIPQIKSEEIINLDQNGNTYVTSDFTYVWLKEDIQIGTSNRQLIDKSGSYSLKASLGSCSSQSFPFNAALTDVNTAFELQSDTVFICENGGEAKLTLEEANATYYAWKFNDEILSFDNYDFRPTNLGKYQAIIEKNGCFDKSNVITVLPNNELPTAKISGDGVFLKGDIVEAKINFTGAGPWTFELSDGFSDETYQNPYVYSITPLQNITLTIKNISTACGFGEGLGAANFTEKLLGLEFEPTILVYPNPSADIVHIQSSLPIYVALFNVNGQKLRSLNIEKQGFINIQNLAEGKYQLVFFDTNSRTKSSFDLIKK